MSKVSGKVTITVHEGKDLNGEDIGKQDPYVKLEMHGEKFKSKVHKKGGKNPKWEQSFLFNVKDYDLKEKLHLQVWDDDLVSDDKIGRIDLTLEQLDEFVEKKEKGDWVQIVEFDDNRKIAGYIRISVEVDGGSNWPHQKVVVPATPTPTTYAPAPTPVVVQPVIQPVYVPTPTPTYVPTPTPTYVPTPTPTYVPTPTVSVSVSVSSSDPLSGAETRIRAKHSGLLLDISGGSTSDGGEVIQWSAHGGANQTFVFHNNGDGSYTIVAKHSGKALDVTGGSKDNGAKIIQWSRHGGDNQKWVVKPHGDGTYAIHAKHSGKSLDVEGGSTSGGAHLIQWDSHTGANQKFELLDVKSSSSYSSGISALAGRAVSLRAKHSGKYLDISGGSTSGGAAAIVWDHHGGANQKFTLTSNGDGTYSFVATHSGKALDINGGSKDNGAKVIQWDRHTGGNQKFTLKDNGDGSYLIIASHSGKALDVTGGSTSAGAEVIQWDIHGGDNQRWIISAA